MFQVIKYVCKSHHVNMQLILDYKNIQKSLLQTHQSFIIKNWDIFIVFFQNCYHSLRSKYIVKNLSLSLIKY